MRDLTVMQMADRVERLLEKRIGLRGRDLSQKLRASRGRLPRRVRVDAELLDRASHVAGYPRLLAHFDERRLDAAYARCTRYLEPIGRSDRRWAFARDVASSVALRLAVTGGLVFTVLGWHGYF